MTRDRFFFNILSSWKFRFPGIVTMCLVVCGSNTRQYRLTALKTQNSVICISTNILSWRPSQPPLDNTNGFDQKFAERTLTPLRGPSIYSHLSKNIQNEPWLTLLKMLVFFNYLKKSSYQYKTNSSWQQNKDDRALKRHDRPI